VEESANEMFVMKARPKEMIGVEHSGEVQGWLNKEELVDLRSTWRSRYLASGTNLYNLRQHEVPDHYEGTRCEFLDGTRCECCCQRAVLDDREGFLVS
jgi:hypothetical protein